MRFKISISFVIFFFRITILAGEYVKTFPDLQVRNCLDEKSYKKYPWPRRLPFEMSAYNTRDTDIETTWDLYSIDSNKDENHMKTVHLGGISIFHIEQFELKQGDYKVEINALVNDTNKIQGSCYLRIQPEDSVAVISGGTSRNYNPGEEIVLDGSLSLDLCNTKSKKSLTYTWNCTQSGLEGFCTNRVETGSRIVIPEEFVVGKEKFRVNLNVKNEDGKISTTYQEIIVKDNSIHFSLKCLDNCPPIVRSPNIAKSSSFAVTCEKYCEECKHNWSMYKGTDRTTLVASSGSCTMSWCRFGNDLYSQTGTYEIVFRCVGNSRSGEVSLVVTFEKAPIFTCNLNKNSGTSYDPFRLNCDYNDKEKMTYFEVYAANNKAGELGDSITSWVPPFTSIFRIAPSVTKIIVRGTNRQGIYSEMLLKVEIATFLNIDGNVYSIIEKLKSLYFDDGKNSVRYSLDIENNIEAAISKIQSIWTCIYMIPTSTTKVLEYKDFIYNFKLYVIDDLEKIPISTNEQLIHLANILKHIILYQTPEKTDPLLAKSLSIICKKFAYAMKLIIEAAEVSEEVVKSTRIIINTLLECGNKNSNENYEIMAPLPVEPIKKVNTSVSTLEETIVEDYEDYEEFDDTYYENLENLMEAVSNTLKTNSLIGTIIVKMIPNGVEKQLKETEDSIQLIYKQRGYDYPEQFEVEGVSVTTSKDIFTYEDIIYLSLTTWRKNIFWFSKGKIKPITYIVNLDLVNLKTDDLVKVGAPYTINLKIKEEPTQFRVISGTISAPMIYEDEEIDEYNQKYMKIYIVHIYRYQTLMIELHDIGDYEFNVVVKDSKVPSYKDLKSRFTVFNKNHTFGYYTNDLDHDSIFYIVILPNRNMLKNASDGSINVSFKITFAGISCFTWSFADQWSRSCKAGKKTNKTHISCECDHLSVVSGFIEPMRSGPLNQHHVDFEIHGSYSIICCIVAVFTFFSVLFLCSGERNKSEIYYAADNVYFERYAYLVVVKTGGLRKTTARVVIKIVGTDHNTTHVLNYPDPECKILKNGVEDWIIVTTKKCLGNITSIILWHDNYGLRPIWVCDIIVIYDMQTYDMWLFKVESIISAFHQQKVVKTPNDILPRLKGVSKERHSWNIFSEDIYRTTVYTLRLMVLYSKLITPLVFAICSYYLATWHEIKNESVISKIEWFCFSMAVLGGFISSLLHFLLRYVFRKNTIYIYVIGTNVITLTTIGVILSFSVTHSAGFLIIMGWLLGMFADIFIYENVKRVLKEHVVGISIAKQLQLLRRQGIRTQINELLVFGVYMVLLYTTVLTQKDDFVVHSHRTLQHLVEGYLTKTDPRIFDVKTLSGMNNYIGHTLIEAIHPEIWYGTLRVVHPGVMGDYNTMIIGVVRIRQHRVKEMPCAELKSFPFLIGNTTCYPDFTRDMEESGTYDGAWTKPTTYVPYTKRMWPMWTYKYSHEIGKYRGWLANYPTGGYTALLGRTWQNSWTNYKVIKNTTWIDRATRSVIAECLTYNPNHNLFASILIVLERGASGLVKSWSEVKPQRMVFIKQELQYTAAIVTITFGVWIGLVLMNRSKALLKRGLLSLKNFWNILDVLIILLSISLIVIYVVRIREVRKVMIKLAVIEHNGFVGYHHLFHMSEIMNVIEAILVFISTVRLWKLLRFLKMFQIFEKTLQFAAGPLLALLLYHNLIFQGFAFMGFLSFGESLPQFGTHMHSQITLLRIYLTSYTDLDPYAFYHASAGAGVCMMVIYLILCYPIMQIYVIVEMFGYEEATDYCSEEGATYSLIDYIKEEVLFKLSIYRTKVKRLRGGGKAKRKVSRKSNSVYYSNCVSTTTDTMTRMTFVANVVLYNILQSDSQHKILDKGEVSQMLRICRYIFQKRRARDTKEIFFKKYDPASKTSRKMKIVDSRRVTAVKKIVDMILIAPESEERTTDDLVQDYDAVLEANRKFLEEAKKVLKKCLAVLQNISFK